MTFIIEVINRFINRSREESGQTLVEYGLIVALISIVSIAIMGVVGTDITAVFQDVSDALAGA